MTKPKPIDLRGKNTKILDELILGYGDERAKQERIRIYKLQSEWIKHKKFTKSKYFFEMRDLMYNNKEFLKELEIKKREKEISNET